ncbi:hypothetical protein OIDMADRAFT_139146, partial [Oidiodendron maius Zn]
QEKVNLARIRDNQRRSRLRRREYLQELETRLRQFELHGIEASAEIQMAARKVADENRKLRGLLALHGIREDSIEVYSQSSSAGDVQLTSRIPSSCNVNSSIITADMISAMAGEDPNTMSADMGCLPGVDCEVKNRLVF